MSEQYLATSRLVNVIQLIALGRQTGVLKVYRGQGSMREQAEIHFAEGRPTYAALGHMQGNAALTVLQNWGDCSYAFLEGPLPAAAPVPPRMTPLPSSGDVGVTPLPSPGTSQAPLTPPPPSKRRTTGPSFFTGPLTPASPPDARGTGSGNVGPFPSRRAGEPVSAPATPPPPRRAPLRGQFVPRRLISMDRLDGLLLERRERMLLLLIDGRRSVADLVRLTRRDEHEVQAVLEYLLTLGLIE